MPVDLEALKKFSELSLKMFWFRQVMFVGATFITTIYLGSLAPILFYFLCLAAEIAEAHSSRKAVASPDIGQGAARKLIVYHTVIGAWSSTAVCLYAIFVAWFAGAEFLFVPITYLYSAALYGTMFNHHIRSVLVARMIAYTLGFLALAVLSAIRADPNHPHLDVAQLLTVMSASFFVVINAIVLHNTHTDRRMREREAVLRQAQLESEIDDRRRAEDEKKKSELRFRSLFENAPIPIREEDLSGMKRLIDGLNLPDSQAFCAYIDRRPEFLDECAKHIRVVDANRASLRQHGYANKLEMLPKVVRELSPAARKIVRLTAEALYEGAPGKSYETKITRVDGQERTVAATWTVLPGYEDSYARILLCSVDLTDRLAAEAALRQAQKMEAVGQLTGGVAHDFNNLLAIIQGNIDLLESAGGVDLEFSQPIKRAVHRGAELTQRLLAFSRKQPLSACAFDLGELMFSMAKMLRVTMGEQHRVKIRTSPGLWPVFADPAQVEAALLNLALNARDAMTTGGEVVVSGRNAHVGAADALDVEPGDYVVLTVSDTGAGMTAEVVGRAYEPFFTTKEVGKGSGLGLSMIYGFAKQSGGALHIESAEGVGTAVSLYLPRSREAARDDDPPAPPPPTHAGEACVTPARADLSAAQSPLALPVRPNGGAS